VNESVVGRWQSRRLWDCRSRPGGDAGNGIQIKADLETEYHFL
jgi:hypothetical protein